MLRGPGTTGGVTTGSKLVIRGIPPTAMGAYPGQDRYEIMASICSEPASKWTPIWLRRVPNVPILEVGVGFLGGHIRNIWRLPEMPVRVELMHRGMPSTEMGERPGSLSVRDSATRARWP